MNRGFPDWIFRRLTGVVAWALFASVLSLILGLFLAAVPVLMSGLEFCVLVLMVDIFNDSSKSIRIERPITGLGLRFFVAMTS